MATYAISGDATDHNVVAARPYMQSVVIDFSSTTNATNDVFQAIIVPAGTVVLAAGIRVLTVDAAGNSGTLALGDGTVVYVAATAPTTAGELGAFDAVAEAFNTYNVADTLDVTVGTGAVDGKVLVWALMCDMTWAGTTQRVTFA